MGASSRNQRVIVPVLAACMASAVYWLGSEFRPSGVLGLLQVALEPLIFLPYVVGAVFGGTVHAPNSIVFAIVLFLQFFLLFSLLVFIWNRLHAQ